MTNPQRPEPRADLTERHEKQQSLWLKRAIVEELHRDPERVLAVARDNLARWRQIHAGRPSILAALDRWSDLIDEGPGAVATMLLAETEEAADMRQNAPFAGVFTDEQRATVLRAFRHAWTATHPTA